MPSHHCMRQGCFDDWKSQISLTKGEVVKGVGSSCPPGAWYLTWAICRAMLILFWRLNRSCLRWRWLCSESPFRTLKKKKMQKHPSKLRRWYPHKGELARLPQKRSYTMYTVTYGYHTQMLWYYCKISGLGSVSLVRVIQSPSRLIQD